MDAFKDFSEILDTPESEILEYKAVLPPARSLAQMIASFANSNGGTIVLGVHSANGEIKITGLSEDFHANSVTHKALDLLLPKPDIKYEYISYKGKRLYVIQTKKLASPVTLENKIYTRKGSQIVLTNPEIKQNKLNRLPLISKINTDIINFRSSSTGAKSKFLDHYSGILNIIDDLGNILYPDSYDVPTTNQEGKILIRILLSSCADNFEIYLTDLLYEIYLANPATLKSNQQVTIKEVLDCSDMQEFVLFWAKKKLAKLQRGSVKGFIADNVQIKDLNVLDNTQQDNIEKILQIRHLYAHRNGIVDEKFLQFYPGQHHINEEHQLSIVDMLGHFSYLLNIVDTIDKSSILKYQLATL
ncbi:putative DNA-binding protein [Chryseobacterium sp. 52]|uniref:AlbA family DNA-binding domain-containing protein n=1 Tax=Chryseobacterium sp. 52 TaxID=2035213 RepID=UPI000C1974CF|nr:ATP-binding protein [Chryseobacterium sp. 52]PIF45320.1 putative DNA-binding protein [Chryseobacterium sp. 52]